MAVGKSIHLFLVILSSASVISHSYAPQTAGRRLFGGYRIVPKPCQPTIPARLKSSEPTICMFNYECSRLNGQVVGACMDGFLFGACCQLPAKNLASSSDQSIAYTDEIFNVHEIDHVPDIPILLNSDGTPLGMAVPQESTMKTEAPGTSNHLNTGGTSYTKISTFDAPSTTIKPTSGVWQIMDSIQNAEKPQLPTQADVSHLVEDFSTLLGQQNVLDDLSLPGLLSHSDSNNDIQNHQDNPAANPITTLLSPDQILQIADPVDQLPALFSQGLGQSNHTSADTILLNENGSLLNETNNPDDLFKPNAESSTEKRETSESASTTQKPRVTESVTITENKTEHDTTHESTSTTQWVKFPDQFASTVHDAPSPSLSDQTFDTSSMTKLPVVTQMYANTQRLTTAAFPLKTEVDDFKKVSTIEERVSTKNVEAVSFANEKTTTPMTTASDQNLVRVPTITYDAPTGNKKHDTEDKEEVAINHIISILNETKPGSGTTIQTPNSSINKWVSIDETSKPTLVRISTRPPPVPSPTTAQSFPYTFYKPIQTTNYQNYETVPTETTYASFSTSNSHSSRPSTQTTFSGTGISEYTSAKITTTNPPAPTVIVLGPLETEFTVETTPKIITKKPITETAGPTVGSIRPHPLTTRKPSVSTTITHNISTVISNAATSNVVSTSFFSVNVKDGTTSKPLVNSSLSTEPVVDETKPEDTLEFFTKRPTTWSTLSTWSNKPTFHLKPSTPPIKYPEESFTPDNPIVFKDPSPSTTVEVKATTAVPHCDEETAAPDDLINFPPVRNPNLNISTPISQQEKPSIMETFNNTGYPDIEILSENDIPTPTFIENDVLSNKVDTFVNKIVQSLQGNFQDLKDIVYNRANATTAAPNTATKRPATTTKRPVRKPTSTAKPSFTTTKKPVTTRRPINRPTSSKPSVSEKPVRPAKPTTLKPKPTTVPSVTTRKPQVTTKRTRPTRRPITTLATSTEAIVVEQEEESSTSIAAETTAGQPPTSSTDFRSQCGIRPLIKTGRIVGGKAASFGEWPWQVLVREATWLGLFTKNKCGGVLITDKYVITAAHCQPGFLATLVAVFGEFDLSGELEEKRSVTRNVRRVIVNRGYNPTTFESDLALLELESPVQFDVHIVPICMPENVMDLTGRMATVTGWGRLKYNGGVPSILQEVQVPIIKNSVCQEMFQTGGHSKLILDSFLCAGYANGQKDSCEGDSGGPLVMQRPDGRWFLVGTVSHGITCAAPYLPGVYMRTTYFKPWLHSITGV